MMAYKPLRVASLHASNLGAVPPTADRERERRERRLQPGQVSPHPPRRGVVQMRRGLPCQHRLYDAGTPWVILGLARRVLPALVDAMTDHIRRGIISPIVSLRLLCHSQSLSSKMEAFRPADDRLACLSRSVISLARKVELLNNG